MSGSGISFLLMIICGIVIAIVGGVLIGKGGDCNFPCGMVVFGSVVFLVALIYWIAGAVAGARIGLTWLKVRFGKEPWWAHLVMVLLLIVGGLLIVFLCPNVC